MRKRYVLRTVIAASAALVAVIAVPPVAYAATTLPANVALVRYAADTYSFTTTLPYWTAVALRPAAGVDFDLRVVDPATGAVLATSAWGAGATDIVAINSNSGFRPVGSYLSPVALYSGSGAYSVMFWEMRVVIPVPTDPVGSTATALGLKFDRPVSAYQIYLRQGQGFRVYKGNDTHVFLAGATPGAPSTYLRNRTQLQNAYVVADNVPSPSGAHCRVFVVPSAGWYSVILTWNTPWSPPPYDGGHAVFPQRYDPSQGDTLTQCPVPQVP